ncbi:MAG TPA: PEP-utilizing enzyme [Candidatus Limnocylindrales bacterium]
MTTTIDRPANAIDPAAPEHPQAGASPASGTAVSWEPGVPGAYTRNLRFGEWISGPVTPLFESWLLTAMEEELHRQLRTRLGQAAPRPLHVVINGWYFYSISWMAPGAMARNLPRMLARAVKEPRGVAAIVPPTVRFSIPYFEREWREDLLPRYRAATAEAATWVEQAPVTDLPALVDRLATLAGEYFTSIAAFAGAAYKMEMNLARFHAANVRPVTGTSHLPLVSGFAPPTDPDRYAVVSLDWSFEPAPPVPAGERRRAFDHARVVRDREAAEAAAFAALASKPARLRAFTKLLRDTQRLVPIREAHVAELTLPWPVMRRAVLRMGEALAAAGVIGAADDVFLLTKAEVLAGLSAPAHAPIDTATRRRTLAEQARLSPPLYVGKLSPIVRRLIATFGSIVGATRSDRAIVSGIPAAAGTATGVVRVIRGPEAFDELRDGEILVAPVTAPAWTPLFLRAAAVVTDVGSAAAHASVIAREYGIPAVVGCGDATARLRTGMRVTVDGSTGNVEAA